MKDRLTAEQLEEWRSHPVTEWVFGLQRRMAQTHEEAVRQTLWNEGKCEPADLAKVKAEFELIEDLTESTHEDFNGWADAFEY